MALGKESTCQCRRCKRCRFNPWVRKTPWSRKWQHIPVFFPGKFHGQRMGYSPVWLSSVTQSCPTLYNPVDCSMPGLPVHHQLLELAQTHVRPVSDAIQPSHSLPPPFPPALSLSKEERCFFQMHQGLFPMSWLFTSGGQGIGASASASVLAMNIQGWFLLGLTGLISLQSKGLSRVFSSTTVWKYQFFSAQPSL